MLIKPDGVVPAFEMRSYSPYQTTPEPEEWEKATHKVLVSHLNFYTNLVTCFPGGAIY